MQIPFQGQINKEEYRKAMELNIRQNRWLISIVIFCFILLVTAFVLIRISDPSHLDEYLPFFVIAIIYLCFPLWFPYLRAQSFNQKGNFYRTPINGVVDDDGISINGQDVKSSILWKAYTRYYVSDGMALLYVGKSRYSVFTAKLFSNEDNWKLFLDVLKDKITIHK